MEDLISNLNNQKLYCQEENMEDLLASRRLTRVYLGWFPRDADVDELLTHVASCEKRYNYYFHHVKFNGHYNYIQESMIEFLNKVKSTKSCNADILYHLLLLSYFIDTEICSKVGQDVSD